MNMTDPNPHPRIIRKGKKRRIPLSSLRVSDAIKIVSSSPRRMEELFSMLEDPDRSIRNRAAATLAQLVTLHPSRLLRAVSMLRESLSDESAYVRWHLVYILGILCALSPARFQGIIPDIVRYLDDENRIVRALASKTLTRIADLHPGIIEELFQQPERDIPPVVADILRRSGRSPRS